MEYSVHSYESFNKLYYIFDKHVECILIGYPTEGAL